MTQVGDTFVLWRAEYNSEAYTDQMGNSHPGYNVVAEYHVVVTEVHNNSQCMWTDAKYPGWAAETENGERFTCNYTRFPSDSMTPTFYWDGKVDPSGEVWAPVDAMQAIERHSVPYVRQNEKAMPSHPNIVKCETHNAYRMGKDTECFRCKCEELRRRRSSSN